MTATPIIFNDPYDGGTHLNDFRLVRPLTRTARCSSGSPRSATGSTSAAMCRAIINAKATESFQEGVRFRR